jgi:hypothetical protein
VTAAVQYPDSLDRTDEFVRSYREAESWAQEQFRRGAIRVAITVRLTPS